MSGHAEVVIDRPDRGGTIRIEAWGPNAIRVRASYRGPIDRRETGGLISDQPIGPAADAAVSVDGDITSLANGLLTATVDRKGEIVFRSADGRTLLRETPQFLASPPPRYFRRRAGATTLHVRFDADPEERLYGLGQQQHGLLDQKGAVVDLLQHNSNVSIPFLLSSLGYGLIWNNPSPGRVELASNRTLWTADNTEQLDYIVIAEPTPQSIVARFTELVGRAPRFPEWASGFWQSRLRYASQEELLTVVRDHLSRGLPLAAIVIDYLHWIYFGDWAFDPAHWPDPDAMVAELRELGVEPVVSVWPAVNENSENYSAMNAGGLLLRQAGGLGVAARFVDAGQQGPAFLHFYDPSNPAARDFLWNAVDRGYRTHGIESFWVDASEPEIVPQEPSEWEYAAGPGDRVGNRYPWWNAQALGGGMTPENPRDAVNLSRSAWLGSQRFGAALWSGDVPSTFESLRAQVPAGLNAGLSGVAWWSSDIGGFHGPNTNESPYLRELIMRWFQFALFTPIMRLHGHRIPDGDVALKYGAPNEVWSFGDEVLAAATKFLALREAMRPYIARVMREASETGMPAMRALFLHFPEDPEAWAVDDAYLFGPDILVAPILDEGTDTRSVRLPGGEWESLQTGETFVGPRDVETVIPTDGIPAFVRAGSAVASEIREARETRDARAS
ncbi:glycoside hydrolase family 31 protein [Herbiconiux ginsengi]|uniref:Alpha-D-xyloside xylohydrolase n=1 Tax=Herbiconiux ginsengi TaxID=381665 RepID=A0A1H3LJ50_9MICO|nr:TIM-barrel domain-containing protein [Herbiconiux ginsengi]SDY63875.1 alpha-D-xyloside xylohydrolase [Herbiconiux ginsengi]